VATPVTSPVESTAATSGWSDFQLIRPGGTGVPSSRNTRGSMTRRSPGKRVKEAGWSVRSVPPGGGRPVSAAGLAVPVMRIAIDARRPWTRASTFARPGLTPTTAPSLPTLATSVSELQKVKRALGIMFPWRS
jgi:hypothetical protein